MKFKYFESEWESRPDWIENAKTEIRTLWESKYKAPPPTPQEQRLRVAQYITTTTTTTLPEAAVTASGTTGTCSAASTETHIPDWKRRKRQRLMSSNQDDFDYYLRRDVKDDLPLGPLKYWIDHAEDLRQKDLAKMALDIFSIPAMSADPERLFSRYDMLALHTHSQNLRKLIIYMGSSKLLLSDRRNRLGDDLIEASECLRSWANDGLVYGGVNSDVNRMQSTLKALELYSVGLRSSSVV